MAQKVTFNFVQPLPNFPTHLESNFFSSSSTCSLSPKVTFQLSQLFSNFSAHCESNFFDFFVQLSDFVGSCRGRCFGYFCVKHTKWSRGVPPKIMFSLIVLAPFGVPMWLPFCGAWWGRPDFLFHCIWDAFAGVLWGAQNLKVFCVFTIHMPLPGGFKNAP